MERRMTAAELKEWALLAEFRAEMSRRGWSRSRMAQESGLSEASVSRYFIRAERSPGSADLFAAAKALGIPLSTLIERAEVAAQSLTQDDVEAWSRARRPRTAEERGDAAIAALPPELAEEVRKVSRRIRPPQPRPNDSSDVG